MVGRFDGWKTAAPEAVPAKVEQKAELKAETPEVKPTANTEEKPVSPKDEKLESEKAAEEVESIADASELQAKIKGLERDLIKGREQKRKLKDELAKERELSTKRADVAVDPDNFETYDDYKLAVKEAKDAPKPQADPILESAVNDIRRKAEKAGVDPEDLLDSLGSMKKFPASAVSVMADRRDAIAIARWLIENEDSDEAAEALTARTDIGRMRAMDDIAEIIVGQKKGSNTPEKKAVPTIPKLGGQSGGRQVDLNSLSTQEFIAMQKESKSKRFW